MRPPNSAALRPVRRRVCVLTHAYTKTYEKTTYEKNTLVGHTLAYTSHTFPIQILRVPLPTNRVYQEPENQTGLPDGVAQRAGGGVQRERQHVAGAEALAVLGLSLGFVVPQVLAAQDEAPAPGVAPEVRAGGAPLRGHAHEHVAPLALVDPHPPPVDGAALVPKAHARLRSII